MRCREVRDRIGGADLEVPFPAEIESHLSGCPRCGRYAREIRRGDAWLKAVSRAAVREPEMERVLSRLHDTLAGTRANGSHPAPSSPRWRFRRTGKEATMQSEKIHPSIGGGNAPSRRSNLRWAMGLALAVLLGGGAGLWVTQQRQAGHSAAEGGQVETRFSEERLKATYSRSVNNLKQVGIAFYMFTEDPKNRVTRDAAPSGDGGGKASASAGGLSGGGSALSGDGWKPADHPEESGKTPPMDDPEAAKQALLPYVQGMQSLFEDPRTNEPYRTNPYVGNKVLADFNNPSDLVTFYEATPDQEGNRRAVFMDGHVQTLTEGEWQTAKKASHIP